jgi:predicted nucleic acid-binding protein
VPFYQLDASAIVKRYVSETGSAWVRVLVDPASANTISLAEVTRAEVANALQRRAREGSIGADESVLLMQTFRAHCATQYRLVPTDHAVVSLAVDLIQRYPLRAYDAVQLATAAHVNETLAASGLPAVVFVSGDDGLVAAALAEGLAVENPSDHP